MWGANCGGKLLNFFWGGVPTSGADGLDRTFGRSVGGPLRREIMGGGGFFLDPLPAASPLCSNTSLASTNALALARMTPEDFNGCCGSQGRMYDETMSGLFHRVGFTRGGGGSQCGGQAWQL